VGDRVLTRNALITGAALGSICLVAAGVALTGRDHRVGSLPGYVASHKAFKAALVEVADQAQIERPTRFAAQPAAPDVRMKTASVEPARTPLAHLPLPHARPKQMVARIPLPRERVAQKDIVVASAGPATEIEVPTIAAAPSPSLARKEEEAVSPPVTLAAIKSADVEATAPAEAPARKASASFALMSYAPTRETLFDADLTGSIGNPARAGTSLGAKTEEASAPPETSRAVVAPSKLAALPPPRPHEKAAKAEPALKLAKPAHKLSIREKLWGSPVRLASLTPMDSGRENDGGIPRAPYDRQTAVYVITDKKVYMPDGSVLEAHSGLGQFMDDPRFAHLRMRGVTPPHVYDLKLREALFHGVEAIRMTPIGGESAIFGRDGILAHTYMLGPNGQSNGCVSFRDYDAFLDAFKDGKINRLAVIAKLD
jgi:hypothetical protein